MDLIVLSETIDRLVEGDPATYADAESMEVLQRQLARLESFVTTATAAFDASDTWALDGARTAASWLATRCRLPKAQARRMVVRGRALRHLPAAAGAWSAGALTGAHVDVLSALRRPATEEALARDEALLVDQATGLSFPHFTRAAAYWEQRADPDGAEAGAEGRRDRRDVYLAAGFGGMWLGQLTLDPVSGAIVADELHRLEREQFEADWAGARTALGREPTLADLPRRPGQRRADALVEMATRSKTAPADGRRPAPLFSVLVDYPTLHGRVCELAQGLALTPGSLLPWLEEALVERVVFGPEGRVEVGATTRLFTGATRRALELRDRECTHPYCDLPAARCQADHVLPYAAGGLTVQENGRLLCAYHNRLRNQRPPPDR
jgi:Domain of unknown function (DUF222)